ENGRGKGQADAVLFVVHGDLTERSGYRDRVFTTGQEAGRIAGQRNEVRLGEAPGKTLLLKRVDQHVGCDAVSQNAGNHEAKGRRARQHASSHFAGWDSGSA